MRGLIVSFILAFSACVPETTTGVDPDLRPGAMTAQERAECQANGGEVVQGLGPAVCATPTPDAGKSCNSGSECSGGLCLAQEEGPVGQCAPLSATFGCMSVMENGEKAMICID